MPLAAIVLVFLSALAHAAWNLIAHSQQSTSDNLLLRCHIVAGLVILLPELIAEWRGDHFSVALWGVILIAGVVHGIYYFALNKGYRSGNFTVVYPLSRALPVLFLTGFDIMRGHEPSLLGWLGILMVVLGCAIVPLPSVQDICLSDYWNWAVVWVFVLALATVCCTIIDKLVVDFWLVNNFAESSRYQLLQALLTIPFLWLRLQFSEEKPNPQLLTVDHHTVSIEEPRSIWQLIPENWGLPILMSLFVFGSYWLMLCAYQLSDYVSYLVALRQISVVPGVVIGAFTFREAAPTLRIGAAVIISVGTLFVSQATV